MSKETDAAYRAGSKVLSVDLSAIPDEKKRKPGAHLNPFGNDRPEEKQAWLQGLRDTLEGKASYDPATLLKEINDDLRVADRAK